MAEFLPSTEFKNDLSLKKSFLPMAWGFFYRSHGPIGHPVPGPDQHLQHHQQRVSQCGRNDGHLRLDACMHVLHFWRAPGLRLHPLLPFGEFFWNGSHATFSIVW